MCVGSTLFLSLDCQDLGEQESKAKNLHSLLFSLWTWLYITGLRLYKHYYARRKTGTHGLNPSKNCWWSQLRKVWGTKITPHLLKQFPIQACRCMSQTLSPLSKEPQRDSMDPEDSLQWDSTLTWYLSLSLSRALGWNKASWNTNHI